jgi:hypothetical protein
MSDPIREWWRRLSVSPALIDLTRRRVAFQWRLRGRPLPPPHVVKQSVILAYQRARHFSTFVETGTFSGEMVAAMRPYFRRIVSIELSPDIHRAAAERFAGDPGIELLLGDSARLLPRVLEQLGEPALFWLDGHFMGGTSARGDQDSPVRAELDALLSHPVRRHVVLIDDARLFSGEEGYPTIPELVASIERERPGSDVRVQDDIVQCSLDARDAVS